MRLSQTELRSILLMGGVPCVAPGWTFFDAYYETVSVATVRKIQTAWMDTLPDELTTNRRIGGGKSVRVPVHTMAGKTNPADDEAGDCDDHGVGLMNHARTGNWLKSVRLGIPLGGLAIGPTIFYSLPSRANGMRSGKHLLNWAINGSRRLYFWEPGDSDIAILTPTERATATWGC